jgi:hypothetical protein
VTERKSSSNPRYARPAGDLNLRVSELNAQLRRSAPPIRNNATSSRSSMPSALTINRLQTEALQPTASI